MKDRSDGANGQIIKMLQGKYSRDSELHNGRVIYKMYGHPHYIYYSLTYGRWVINTEINERFMAVSSLSGDVPCPSMSKYWMWFDHVERHWTPVSHVSVKCIGECKTAGNTIYKIPIVFPNRTIFSSFPVLPICNPAKIPYDRHSQSCLGSSCEKPQKGKTAKNFCHENAVCEKSSGSATCTCLDGFFGNGKDVCHLPCKPLGGLSDEHYKVITGMD